MAYTNPTINTATPGDNDQAALGDNEIRNSKRDWKERLQSWFVSVDTDPMVPKAGIIATASLTNLAVDTTKLADNAVTQVKIADNAVGTAELINDSVTAAKIATGAVGADEIADGSVGTNELANGAVTSGKLATGAVTANELAGNAVSTAKLQDGSVTQAKLGAGVTADVADNSITNAKMADEAIGLAEISTAMKALIAGTKHVDVVIGAAFALPTNSSTDIASIPMTGAAVADSVEVGFPSGTAGFSAPMRLVTVVGWVPAGGSVQMRFQNNSGGPVTVPAGTWKLSITKPLSEW